MGEIEGIVWQPALALPAGAAGRRIGECAMIARETLAERERKALDLQLDEELKATFPASDPLKITRRSAQARGAPPPSPNGVPARKQDRCVRAFK
jgi:hypothetical protein